MGDCAKCKIEEGEGAIVRADAALIATNMYLTPQTELLISKEWAKYAQVEAMKGVPDELLKTFQKRISDRKKNWLMFRSLVSNYRTGSKSMPKAPGLRIVYLVSDVAKFATLLIKRLLYGEHNKDVVDHIIVAFCAPHNLGAESIVDTPGYWAGLQEPNPYVTFLNFVGMRATEKDGSERSVKPDEIAQLLNQMNADIIIDVNLNPLFEILCLRPAPIQISWLGRPFSTGSSHCVDYFVADATVIEPHLSPGDQASYAEKQLQSSSELRAHSSNIAKVYAEKLLVLPDTMYVADFQEKSIVPSAPLRGEPSIEHRKERATLLAAQKLPDDPDAIVLANFNQLWKLDAETLKSWARILKKTKNNVVLWLLEFSLGANINQTKEILWRSFEQNGVPRNRIYFGEALGGDEISYRRHLERATLVDVYVDSFEYNMAGTAISLLTTGVPLVTLPGLTLKSRMAASIVRGLELDENLVATSIQDYEAKILRLVEAPASYLADLRNKILLKTGYFREDSSDAESTERRLVPASTSLNPSALFDLAGFVRKLERGLQAAWEVYLQGQPPDHLVVPKE
eukprot:TRINITY_DN4810_c0_g1_i1.p1 TRINITY_DN4810_c0_g1~~TRINITY_DN4810_c0_g1_i1.p1  ORF type:complete len:570 (+),score=70.97 TRINITY_DN4810_c0_g1_i1:270-1979(+)